MPPREDIFYAGHYYHAFNRGINKENIFLSKNNYFHCLRLIKKYSKKYDISVIAYCLMPNHYHFLLYQNGEKMISQFIGTLFNAYAQAFNNERHRKGALFEGRFKHVHVDKEAYLIYLCRYIHRNPVDANIVKQPEDWMFSNYREWVGQRN